MTTRSRYIRHVVNGGWSTDFGPRIHLGPDDAGVVALPFLFKAENCVYDEDGWPYLAPGAVKLNSGSLESGADIRGIFDFWNTGSAGSPEQSRIIHIGTKIKADRGDGIFTDIFTGMSSTSIPSYTVLEDLCIISSTGADTPRSFDGGSGQVITDAPNFSFATTHANRVWAAGDPLNPGTLYYSEEFDGTIWTSGTAGSIKVDPRDGDEITGLISHNQELLVFKGPFKGSIHRISGTAPTGNDAFSRTTLINAGVGAVAHNTVFRFGSDIGFVWTDGTVRSLAATEAFGDYLEASLSRPIQGYLDEKLSLHNLHKAWAFNCPQEHLVLFALPINTAQLPNTMLAMDYRRGQADVRWAHWPDYTFAQAAGLVFDAGLGRATCYTAGSGFVRRLLPSLHDIDGSAINFKFVTPFNTFGSPFVKKTLEAGMLAFDTQNDATVTFGWQRDNETQQTTTVTQGGNGLTLPFTLPGTFGTQRMIDKYFRTEEGGEFRAAQFEVSQAVTEDIRPKSLDVLLHVGAESFE